MAPATATATNENQDNDVISNTAQNAGGRRKRKKRSTRYFRMKNMLNSLFAKLHLFLSQFYLKRDFVSENDNYL